MNPERETPVKIPGENEWAGLEADVAALRARSFWFGRSLDDLQRDFTAGRGIYRGQELLHMPRAAFQFYIFAFAQYLMSDAAIGDPDGASTFLESLLARERRDPGSVAQIYARLAPTIDFVAASQARFDASHGRYGDFREKAEELEKLCATPHSRRDPENQMLDPTDDA